PGATLPPDFTFELSDQGAKTFTNVKLKTYGNQTITATDTINGSVTGSVIVTVVNLLKAPIIAHPVTPIPITPPIPPAPRSGPGFTTAHNASLAAILAEWQSGNSYSLRIAHIRGTQSGGLNGTNYLNSTTVSDDGAADTLTGGAGLDWFWGLLAEITDLNNGG